MAVEQPLLLSVPTPDDFQGMAVLQTAAFIEKQGWGESSKDIEMNNYKTYQRYHKECPIKLTHCRIIKSPDGATVLAACQLHLRRRKDVNGNNLSDKAADVFIEWIACHPDHMNKGMGSTLLAWAASFAKEELLATSLTLYVIKANTRAVRLYKRRGFVTQGCGRRNMCDKITSGILSLFCLGCDRHWTVLTMEKNLAMEAEIAGDL